jgi:hypothetical protein
VKNIIPYNEFNESLKDKLKGKSEEEIKRYFERLSDSDRIKRIFKYKLPYDLLPDDLLPNNLVVNGFLDYRNNNNLLPDNLTVNGYLECHNNHKLTSLPDNLTVNGGLDCSFCSLTSLPNNLIVGGDLKCHENLLPKDIKKPIGVKGEIYN